MKTWWPGRPGGLPIITFFLTLQSGLTNGKFGHDPASRLATCSKVIKVHKLYRKYMTNLWKIYLLFLLKIYELFQNKSLTWIIKGIQIDLLESDIETVCLIYFCNSQDNKTYMEVWSFDRNQKDGIFCRIKSWRSFLIFFRLQKYTVSPEK